jgi:transcriptional regulator with XRE-family HTH domain
MTTTQRPPDYAEGYGELVRAHRLYIGASQRTMAERIGMAERSLSDIEVGRRACPPGFIDTLDRVVGEFDDAVDTVMRSARQRTDNDGHQQMAVEVSDKPNKEWDRLVMGRAAVHSKGRIVPVLSVRRAAV